MYVFLGLDNSRYSACNYSGTSHNGLRTTSSLYNRVHIYFTIQTIHLYASNRQPPTICSTSTSLNGLESACQLVAIAICPVVQIKTNFSHDTILSSHYDVAPCRQEECNSKVIHNIHAILQHTIIIMSFCHIILY